MDTVNHVVGGVTSSSANSNMLSPEHQRKDLMPLGLIALAGLHDGFSHIEMLRLNDAISLGVVSGDANVVDAVSVGEDIQGGDVSSSIVSDYLFESTPSAEDILEDEVGDDLSRVGGSSTTFWVRSESISGMDNVAVRSELRH